MNPTGAVIALELGCIIALISQGMKTLRINTVPVSPTTSRLTSARPASLPTIAIWVQRPLVFKRLFRSTLHTEIITDLAAKLRTSAPLFRMAQRSGIVCLPTLNDAGVTIALPGQDTKSDRISKRANHPYEKPPGAMSSLSFCNPASL